MCSLYKNRGLFPVGEMDSGQLKIAKAQFKVVVRIKHDKLI